MEHAGGMRSWPNARGTRPHRAGLTLVELLFCIVILSLAVFAMVHNLTHILVGIRQNKTGLLAKAAAERELERRVNQGFYLVSGLGATANFTPTADGVNPIPGATGQLSLCDADPVSGACTGSGTSKLKKLKKLTASVTLDPSRVYRVSSFFTDWTAGLAAHTSAYYPG